MNRLSRHGHLTDRHHTLVRLEMLNEAIHVIWELWMGGLYNYRGKYFTVENAQLFSLPTSHRRYVGCREDACGRASQGSRRRPDLNCAK